MFGDNLKKYRIDKGLSQNDIAEKLFVTRQCVSKWEKGVTQPDLQTLSRLSELLDVRIDELINGSDAAVKKRVNTNKALFIANILVAVFCIISFLAVWNFLPKTIPAHWAHGVINRYGSRNEIFMNMILPVILLCTDICVLFAVRKINDVRLAYIAHGVIILMQIAYLIFIIVLYDEYLNNVLSFITCLSSVLVMCLSIIMHPKLNKQNFLIGVRTKETLQSEQIWNKANALACYLFTGCSVAVFTVNMLWPSVYSCLSLLAYAVLAITVVIYSKILFRAEKKALGK